MIFENAKRRLHAVGVLLENISATGISNNTKSSYYRSVLILLSTIVEGLVYELVRRSTISTGHVVDEKTEHAEKYKIPAAVLGAKNDYYLCEKTKKKVLIADNGVTFGVLNNYLKNKRIVSLAEYKLLDWSRKERNKLHLQSLTLPDTGYTKSKIDKMGSAVFFLLKKMT